MAISAEMRRQFESFWQRFREARAGMSQAKRQAAQRHGIDALVRQVIMKAGPAVVDLPYTLPSYSGYCISHGLELRADFGGGMGSTSVRRVSDRRLLYQATGEGARVNVYEPGDWVDRLERILGG